MPDESLRHRRHLYNRPHLRSSARGRLAFHATSTKPAQPPSRGEFTLNRCWLVVAAFWIAQVLVSLKAQAVPVDNHLQSATDPWWGGATNVVCFHTLVIAGNDLPPGDYGIFNAQGRLIRPFSVGPDTAPQGTVVCESQPQGNLFDYVDYGTLSFPGISTSYLEIGLPVPMGQTIMSNRMGCTLRRSGVVLGQAIGGEIFYGSCVVGGEALVVTEPLTYIVYYDPNYSDGGDGDGGGETPPDGGLMIIDPAQAGPALYRKTALNGRPLPNAKPQAMPESDAAPEETYVDSFTLGLHHDQTDIYVPIASTDLALQVRRSTVSEVWSNQHGLQPSEMPDRPFGGGWTSNLGANIHFVRQTPLAGAMLVDVDYAYVTDEDGSTYRFLILNDASGKETYLPVPDARNQQDAFVNTLISDGAGHWIFLRKYGTRLIFAPTSIRLTIDGNRLYFSSIYRETHTFARLTQIVDRTGVSLVYSYSSGDNTITPSQITVEDAAGALHPAQQLVIQADANGRVQTVADPQGNTWTYGYSQQPSPASCATLSTVTAPVRQKSGSPMPTYYGYNVASIDDTLPGQYPDPTLHLDVSSFQDPMGKTYAITYQADQSCKVYMGVLGYCVAPRLPLIVSRVDLPDGLGSAVFQNHSFTAVLPDYNTMAVKFYGHKATYVIDAVGNGRLYQFVDPVVNELNSLRKYFTNADILDPFRIPRIILFQQNIITLFDGQNVAFNEGDPANFSFSAGAGTVMLGGELFAFDLLAGLAPSSTTDFSGNPTTFEYNDAWNFNAIYASLPDVHYAFGAYGDPTAQIDAKGQRKSFQYFPAPANGGFDPRARRMTQMVDEAGRTTKYFLDLKGNRISEQIFDDSQNLVKWTDFEYGNADYPGFMTKQTVHAGGSGAK